MGAVNTVSATLEILRQAYVPARFRAASFDDYEPQTPSQKAALVAAQRFVVAAKEKRPAMLALVGRQGTGKSHLLYAVVNALLDAGFTGSDLYARPWYTLADELRYGGVNPFNQQMIERAEVRRLLWSRRVVAIDEVRATASTRFDDTKLAKFACHAYDSNCAAIITTNVNPLDDIMGPPAASRFAKVVIDGPDHRNT